jgi:hypothetical protein
MAKQFGTRLVDEMCSKFIIPYWYEPSDFEQMEGWDEEQVEDFKKYLIKCVSRYDGIREYVEEVLDNYIDEKEKTATKKD